MGYVLARALGTVLGERTYTGHKVQRGKKGEAILKMMAYVMKCLAGKGTDKKCEHLSNTRSRIIALNSTNSCTKVGLQKMLIIE